MHPRLRAVTVTPPAIAASAIAAMKPAANVEGTRATRREETRCHAVATLGPTSMTVAIVKNDCRRLTRSEATAKNTTSAIDCQSFAGARLTPSRSFIADQMPTTAASAVSVHNSA